jgi:branched-chain amino acid transport system permease protein
MTELSSAIYGFLLVMMMILRPEGLIPERRRKLELTEHVGVGATTGVGGPETDVFEARA